jgi:hypothetical protein
VLVVVVVVVVFTLVVRAATTAATRNDRPRADGNLRLDRRVESSIETKKTLRERLFGRGFVRGDFTEDDEGIFFFFFFSFLSFS